MEAPATVSRQKKGKVHGAKLRKSTHALLKMKKRVDGGSYLFRVLLVICFPGVTVGSKSLHFKHLSDNKQKEKRLIE